MGADKQRRYKHPYNGPDTTLEEYESKEEGQDTEEYLMEKEEGNHICDSCDYETENMDQVIEHIDVVHKNQMDFSCNICKLKFRNKLQYNTHMVNKHRKTYKLPQGKPYHCRP